MQIQIKFNFLITLTNLSQNLEKKQYINNTCDIGNICSFLGKIMQLKPSSAHVTLPALIRPLFKVKLRAITPLVAPVSSAFQPDPRF